ncbi:serine/threonine-protein kinase [Kitasatospora sp. NPDC127059]|uniref:serine/threonine-protein kinase n=1 Tax=unclassified Kitasatospora TaxID=2633591 RepID=UPI0036600312
MTLSEHDPREIGGYLLEGRLGAGGMGVVYRARSVSGRQVAVKVIRPELAADAEFRARFRQEVTAARKVSGAFTAPVLDADPDAPAPWLATLFIPGPSLGERIVGQGPLTPPEVRRLAAGLAEALQEIHRVGLVHRDLKPGNVLLAEDGPRVIDFGIARSAGETQLTSTGVAVGTPPFMAPEQFRSGTATTATDVFALGSVLAFAATGRGPFGADSSHAVGFRVVYEEPDLAGLAPELLPLITGCLAKDPEQRPTVEGLLRIIAESARERTVRLRTGPVALAAVPAPAPAAPAVPTPTAASPLTPAVPTPTAASPHTPAVPTPTAASPHTPAVPTPTAASPVAPPPEQPPVPPAAPPHLPPSSAAERGPRPRRALLIGSALAAVVVAAAGTLGYLAWHDREPSTGQTGQAGQAGPSAAAAGLGCAPADTADTAVVGSDGMEADLVKKWTADFGKACPSNRLSYRAPLVGDPSNPFGNTNVADFAVGRLEAATVDEAVPDGQVGQTGRHCVSGQMSQVPIAVLPVAVVFNVPGVTDLVFDAPTLAKIFRGQIRTWNDPAIRALNPATVLPGSSIDVRVPTDLSWSAFVFAHYLGKAAPADWPFNSGPVWDSGEKAGAGATEAGIPGAIAGAMGSIGFVPLKDVGNLHTARVRTGDGDVAPSTAGANAMAATGTVAASGSRLSVELDYQKPVKSGYPVVGFGYLDFCGSGGGAAVMASFASYAVSAPGQATGESLKYGALPPAMTQQVQGVLTALRSK